MERKQFIILLVILSLSFNVSTLSLVTQCQNSLSFNNLSCLFMRAWNPAAAELIGDQVVPDVLDSAPTGKVSVSYGNTAINYGNILNPSQAREPPTSISWPFSFNLYTLVFVDPDAPSRAIPTSREFRHWLVVNIPGTYINWGTTLTEYLGPSPPVNTDFHRYVFAVFKQPGYISPTEQGASRQGFSTRAFSRKYNLQIVAANFFRAEHA